MTSTVFTVIADGAARESRLWGDALLPPEGRDGAPVFSRLVADAGFALGVETIYEGYLLHYGRPRLFAPPDGDVAILLGDALLAHGLVRIAETGSLAAVADLAELLSLCAQARGDPAMVIRSSADNTGRTERSSLTSHLLEGCFAGHDRARRSQGRT
jgi:hypothetical protein